MKTRNGFVSNSSSSSFIIAFKTPDMCEKCGRAEETFLDKVRHSSFGGTCIEAVGCDEVTTKCEESEVEKINKYQDAHPEMMIAAICLSNHDPLIDEIRISKDLVILEDVNYS